MSKRGSPAWRAMGILMLAIMAAGAFVVTPAGAGSFLTKKKGDARYVNVGEKASDSDLLDGMDSTAFASGSHTHAASSLTGAIDADTVDGREAVGLQALGSHAENTTAIVPLTTTYQTVVSTTLSLPSASGGQPANFLLLGSASVTLGLRADQGINGSYPQANCRMRLTQGATTTTIGPDTPWRENNNQANANAGTMYNQLSIEGGATATPGSNASVFVECQATSNGTGPNFEGPATLNVTAIPQ